MSETPLLEVERLAVRYPIRSGLLRRMRGVVNAVDGISFSLGRAETLGLVGESGCGKSTTARAVAMLTPPSEGSIRLDGVELIGLPGDSLREMRRRMQIVFQDPSSSLDPRMKIQATLTEPLVIHGLARGAEALDRTRSILAAVGL